MVSKFKNLTFLISILISALLPIATAAPVFADQVQDNLCSGSTKLTVTQGTAGECATDTPGATATFDGIIKKVINIISTVVGIVAVVMIVLGGFRYVTSGGDSTKVTSAKNTILYALIGLVIVALAQIIVRFVLHNTTAGSTAGGGSKPCVQLPNGSCAPGTGP